MTSPEDLQKCFEANSLAPFFALKYAPAAMGKLASKGNYPNAAPKDQKYGSIIVVSSVASTYGGCWGPCYTMSSHAALGVVRAGVAVLKGSGVRINCISPGQIDVGIDWKGFDMRGMKSQLPPASLQSAKVTLTALITPKDSTLTFPDSHRKSILGLSGQACQSRSQEWPDSWQVVLAVT